MVSIDKIQTGVTAFLENEIVDKMSGWQKWVFGAGLGLAMNHTQDIFTALKNNPLVQMMGVIQPDGTVDLDALYREFKKQAMQGPAVLNIPGIPAITLYDADVDKLYQYIMSV